MTVSDQFRAVERYKITNLQLLHEATPFNNKSIPDDDFLLYFQSNSSLIPVTIIEISAKSQRNIKTCSPHVSSPKLMIGSTDLCHC